MGVTIHRQVGLSCGRGELIKLMSNIPLWSLLQFLPPGLCLEILPWLPLMVDYEWQGEIVFLLSQVDFGHCFITAMGKQTVKASK